MQLKTGIDDVEADDIEVFARMKRAVIFHGRGLKKREKKERKEPAILVQTSNRGSPGIYRARSTFRFSFSALLARPASSRGIRLT